MRIQFRIYEPRKDGIRKYLTAESDAFRKINWEKPFYLKDDSTLLDEFLDATVKTHAVQMHSQMDFASKELAQIKLFTIGTRKTFPSSSSHFDSLREYQESIPLCSSRGGFKVRLVESYHLGSKPFEPNAVGILDGFADILVGDAVRKFLSGFNDAKLHFKAVLNRKSKTAIHGTFLMYSERFAPPLAKDSTMKHITSHGQNLYKILGAVALPYSELDSDGYFYRSSEPLFAFSAPAWYFSDTVVRAIKNQKMSGWTFAPVLNESSVLYAEYLSKWSQVLQKIEVNPENKVI